MRNVVPNLSATTPLSHVVFSSCPVNTVGIMIDNCNAPRHNDVVADYEPSIADQIAPANERTAPYPNFAIPFLKAYVGMDYRFIKSFSKRTKLSKQAYDNVVARWQELGLSGTPPVVSVFEDDELAQNVT